MDKSLITSVVFIAFCLGAHISQRLANSASKHSRDRASLCVERYIFSTSRNQVHLQIDKECFLNEILLETHHPPGQNLLRYIRSDSWYVLLANSFAKVILSFDAFGGVVAITSKSRNSLLRNEGIYPFKFNWDGISLQTLCGWSNSCQTWVWH